MKKTICVLLSLVLLLGILLVSCAPKETLPAETVPVDIETAESIQEETLSNNPVTVKENYLPSHIFTQIKEVFEGKQATFSDYGATSAPYALGDVFTVSNCRLLSITIPVYKTGALDSEGNLVFTIYVVGNSYEGLRQPPKKTYSVKVNAGEHDLSANQAATFRWLTVDLSEYDIVLGENETLAYYSATDTIIPAFIPQDATNTHKALTILKEEFPQITGFFNKVGSDALSPAVSTLFFDFEWERTYESQEAYQAMLDEKANYEAMVKALEREYGGAYLSILGDSISTFAGVSNDREQNSTIGGNAVWYPDGNTNLLNESMTYWGRMIQSTGMRLCVNNSWSGSRVYGAAGGGSGNMLSRATQLHKDNGTQSPGDDIDPNLIFVYMGINDLHNDNAVPFGDLYQVLANNDGRTDHQKIEAWFADVLTQAQQTNSVKQGETYRTFEQAYALSLHAMKEKYSNARIYCFTYVKNMDPRCTDEKLEKYNTCVRALASYFELGLIDQSQGYITESNFHSYSNDTQYLHPNAAGHQWLQRLIVETLYKDL